MGLMLRATKKEGRERSIWRFALYDIGINFVEVPMVSRFFYVGYSDGLAYVWAVVDSTGKNERETVEFFVTDDHRPFLDPRPMEYLGTATEGVHFWHVFRVIEGGIKNVSKKN